MLRFSASDAEGNTSIPCPLFPRPTFWPVVKGTVPSWRAHLAAIAGARRFESSCPYPLIPRPHSLPVAYGEGYFATLPVQGWHPCRGEDPAGTGAQLRWTRFPLVTSRWGPWPLVPRHNFDRPPEIPAAIAITRLEKENEHEWSPKRNSAHG
jgi:hypothetical protein